MRKVHFFFGMIYGCRVVLCVIYLEDFLSYLKITLYHLRRCVYYGWMGWRRCHRIFLGRRCRGYIFVLCWTTFVLRLSYLIKWTWKVDCGEKYPDKGVYHLTMQMEHDEPMTLKNLIRNKVAHPNVSCFHSRLLNNWILTKLVWWSILNMDSFLCSDRCQKEENVNHFYF